MAIPTSASCLCNGDRYEARVSLLCISEAVAVDDIDRAIDAGLLRWNGCMACAIAASLNPAAIEQMRAARQSRLSALGARERHRSRQQRLQQRSAERDARHNSSDSATPMQSALPSAAAAALERAKAKAAARAKS